MVLPHAAGSHPSGAVAARLLAPDDDVATALRDLAEGETVVLRSAGTVRNVTLVEDVPLGFKFALRPLGEGLRIRKYGELIGRLTGDVPAGACVHVHNLVTSARRDPRDEAAWRRAMDLPASMDVLGTPLTMVGESPVFDAARGGLWWVDVRETPAIHYLHLASGLERSFPQPEDVGSVALAGPGRLLAATRTGFHFIDAASGTRTPIVDPEAGRPANRMNDGKCDPAGRFWCGSMNPESGMAEGSLYALDSTLECRRLFGGLFTPNGLAWSPDGRTMYLADTRRSIIEAIAFDPVRGELGERRLFSDCGALPGGPDGACVDREGFLWSAHWDGGCLVRYAPDGRVDRVVHVPVTRPTSCAFGGDDYATLFVTTARRGLAPDRLRDEPHAGRVLALDVGACGLPPVPFDGN